MSREHTFLSIISGHRRGPAAALARAGLSLIEPAYASVAGVRNKLFNIGAKGSHALGRPTISVGNLTTGGTGKTPIVQWLATTLLAHGRRPAVLLRGYRSAGGVSDEAELYRQIDGLGVEPDPDRVAAAARVLARSPLTDVFLLDDGFQHRRVRRDLDVVLIDASNPFGHGHVLPRGLLREPAAGLARADVVVITRAEYLQPQTMATLRRLNPTAPILHCRLSIRRFVDRRGNPVEAAALKGCVAVAGIGNPQAFFDQLPSLGVWADEHLALADHETFDDATLHRLGTKVSRGRPLLVTEKDFVKLARRPAAGEWPIVRAMLEVDFADGDAEILLGRVEQAASGLGSKS